MYTPIFSSATARSMIGTPYSELDCIEAKELYTALMTDTLIEEV